MLISGRQSLMTGRQPYTRSVPVEITETPPHTGRRLPTIASWPTLTGDEQPRCHTSLGRR
jgi:hypothetical protein